jgi:hypothetical protein
MESSLGVNITEVTQGISKTSKIYTDYFDASDGPEGIRRLVSTVKDLHDVLKESENLLHNYNRPYPGQWKLNRRLDEIEIFVGKYCKVGETSPEEPSASPPQRRRVWTELQYAFERRRAVQMRESLLMEVQKFIQFILVLCLRTNNSRPRDQNRRHSGRIEPANSTIEDIAKRLSELKYQVERRQIKATQLDPARRRALYLSDLETQLDREWNLLCLRAGFEDHDHRPPLPSSAHNLLLSSTQIYQDMIIAHNRDTMVSPTRESFEDMSIRDGSTAESTKSGKQRSKLETRDDTTLPIELSQHHVILGDPALPLCVAEFEMRPRQMLKLQIWKFSVKGDHKMLTWTGTKAGNVLEHHMTSPDIIPYSLHSSLKSTEKGFSLTFHGSSRIRWLKDGSQKLNELRPDIKYQFVEFVDFKRFQEEFRDLYLIDTFDIESVRTQWSKGRFEAVNQDLKIWRSREDDTYTISFFANHLKEHLEFSLDWFSDEIQFSSEKQTVVLAFSEKTAKSWKASLRRRLTSQSKRAPSFDSDLMERSNMWTSVGSMASPRGSVSTVGSSASSIGPSPGRIAEMVSWTEKFRHLTIQFSSEEESSLEDRNEEDGYSRFCRRIEKIMKAQRNMNMSQTSLQG